MNIQGSYKTKEYNNRLFEQVTVNRFQHISVTQEYLNYLKIIHYEKFEKYKEKKPVTYVDLNRKLIDIGD